MMTLRCKVNSYDEKGKVLCHKRLLKEFIAMGQIIPLEEIPFKDAREGIIVFCNV